MANDDVAFWGIAGVSEKGWIPPEGDIDLTKLARDFKKVRKLSEGFQWAEADMILFFMEHPDDGAWQELEIEDYESETKRRAARVAMHVPHEERRWSIWKHEEILRIPAEIRHEFTEDWSEEKPPTVSHIRDRAAEYEGKNQPQFAHRECPSCGADESYWTKPPIELEEPPPVRQERQREDVA